MPKESQSDQKLPSSREIGDFDQAAAARREASWALPMSERLVRMHALCKQVSAIKGAAQAH